MPKPPPRFDDSTDKYQDLLDRTKAIADEVETLSKDPEAFKEFQRKLWAANVRDNRLPSIRTMAFGTVYTTSSDDPNKR
jgi:hypothetical protein